jgi:hypothetical protein
MTDDEPTRPAASTPATRWSTGGPVVVCPECQTVSPLGTDRCPNPNCGYPLVLERPITQESAVDPRLFVKPGEDGPADHTWAGLGPASDDLASQGAPRPPVGQGLGGPTCPACGHENPRGRERWCAWCGEDMLPPPRAMRPPPAPVIESAHRAWWLWLIAVLAALLIAAGVVWGIRRTASNGERPTAHPAPTPSLLDSSGITARASSTRASDRFSYGIQNTLDGRDDTAWNSDPKKGGRGIGITLTYEFGRQVDLKAITMRNGSVRSAGSATIYADDERLHGVTVRTDHGTFAWSLRDTPDLQILQTSFGETAAVTLTVQSVYAGHKYQNLALTEISFVGVG